jgi:hypothetical protein
MRPKYVLWLTVAALFLSWYLLDPDARRSDTGQGTDAGMHPRITEHAADGQPGAHTPRVHGPT